MYTVIHISRHADAAADDEGLSTDDLTALVRSGDVIEEGRRPGRPLPTRLLLARVRGRAYHIDIGYDDARSYANVVTIYAPDPALWSPDFRRRASQ